MYDHTHHHRHHHHHTTHTTTTTHALVGVFPCRKSFLPAWHSNHSSRKGSCDECRDLGHHACPRHTPEHLGLVYLSLVFWRLGVVRVICILRIDVGCKPGGTIVSSRGHEFSDNQQHLSNLTSFAGHPLGAYYTISKRLAITLECAIN